MTPLLALRDIRKRFGSVEALDQVGLDVRAGEVHAVVGENGAGKSTLVRVVAGLVTPDHGEIELDGRPVRFAHRRDAAAAGIGVVHQHFSLVDTFTAAENLELGRPGAKAVVGLDRARADLRTWAGRTGLPIDPDVPVGPLSVGERQRVEILSALAWGARVLLLDEPTAVLSPLEADRVLAVVRELADGGLAVVLVTHKLREVEAVADRATVMRAGRIVGHHEGRGIDRAVLAAEMIGTGRVPAPTVARAAPGPPVLELAGVSAGRLHAVDLVVRSGEIVGVAGVAGNGQTDLVGCIAGTVRPAVGAVRVAGRDPHARGGHRDVALAYVPEDRAAEALALDLPVWFNAVAKRTAEVGGWRGVDRGRVRAITRRVIDRLGVVPASPGTRAGALSGGNQQRLVIGRELDGEPPVVLAVEPTRGLDPGSTLDVLEALRHAADDGAGVLVLSSELDEVLLLADRVVVLAEGRVVLDVPRADATRDAVGRAMVGA